MIIQQRFPGEATEEGMLMSNPPPHLLIHNFVFDSVS